MNTRVLARLGAIAALALSLAACRVELYSNVTEREANEMVAALAAQGITAGKASAGDKGWQLQVDERDVAAALEVLRARGLPQERFVSLGDMFQKQGLVATPAEERIRYIHGLSQELSRTLQSIDGVVTARVHVVVPASDPLSDRTRPSSAAVFIKHLPDTDLRTLVPAVKEMVAHSIEGLTHEQVSLTLYESRRVTLPQSVAPAVPRGEGPLVGALAPGHWVLLALGALAVVALTALPTLLRREGMDWREFARRIWRRP